MRRCTYNVISEMLQGILLIDYDDSRFETMGNMAATNEFSWQREPEKSSRPSLRLFCNSLITRDDQSIRFCLNIQQLIG